MVPSPPPAPEPVFDPARLGALRRTHLLDADADPVLDRLTRLASRLVGAPMALVSLVDTDRQFFMSQVGMSEPWASRRETPLSHSICQHVVGQGEMLVVDDARQDPRLVGNQAMEALGCGAYLGSPLTTPEGHVLGSLCVMAPQPRRWTAEEQEVLHELSLLAMTRIQRNVEIAGRKRLEEELRAVRKRLQGAVDLGPTILYVLQPGEDGRFQPVWVSGNVERILGYTAKEALAPGWWSRNLHPEDRRAVFAAQEELGRHGRLTHEYRFRDAQGGYRWIRDEIHRESDGDLEYVGGWTDVTSQRHQEERGRAEYLSSLMADTRDIAVVLKPDGTIRFVSPGVETVLGIAPEDVVGENVFESLLHPEEVDEAVRILDQVVGDATARPTFTCRVRHTDGGWRVLRGGVQNLLARADVQGIVITSRDVTDELRMEEVLRRRERMEALGRLAGGVAHDLNNILFALKMNADLLNMELAGTPEAVEVDELLRAVGRGERLVRQLLDYSRAREGEDATAEVTAVVEDMATMLGRLMGGGVTLETRLPPEPLAVPLGRAALEQIVMNLVLNARDALPRGRGLVELTVGTARLPGGRGGSTAPYALLSVRDNGTGIPAEIRERIFEPLYTTKGEGEGTGLGLATVSAVVARCGGLVDVESEMGVGSTFKVYLPIAPDARGLRSA